MVQLQLAQSANGTFRVTDAVYCPDDSDIFLCRGLGIQGCEIQVLDSSWNDRREFVAVDPVLWATLCLPSDLGPRSGIDELARTFVDITKMPDCFYRRQKAIKVLDMPLVATGR